MSEGIQNFVDVVGDVAVETTGAVTSEAGGLMKVLTDFNVIGFALGVLMANAGKDLANSVIDGVIMPTLKPALDRITPQGKATLRIGSIEINLEKLITALIRFVSLGLVVYLLIKVGVKMNKPTAWVSIRSVADGVSL
jgi:large-conductance mechanosensitive channel